MIQLGTPPHLVGREVARPGAHRPAAHRQREDVAAVPQGVLGLGPRRDVGPRPPVGVALRRDVAREHQHAVGLRVHVILEPALETDVEAIAAHRAARGDGVAQLPRVGLAAGRLEELVERSADDGLGRSAHGRRGGAVDVRAPPLAVVDRDVITERVEDVEMTLAVGSHQRIGAEYSPAAAARAGPGRVRINGCGAGSRRQPSAAGGAPCESPRRAAPCRRRAAPAAPIRSRGPGLAAGRDADRGSRRRAA